MDLELRDKVAIVTGSSRGLGLAAPGRWPRKGAVSRSAGGPSQRCTPPHGMWRVSLVARTACWRSGRPRAGRRRAAGDRPCRRALRWDRCARQQRRACPRSRRARDLGRRMAGGVRSHAVARGARHPAGGAAHDAARRRLDHHHRVDLRPRSRRTHDLQRRQSREISLAKSLAQQLAPANIRVNSVSPGSFLFEGGSWWKRQQENPAAIAEYVKRELPFGRFGKPDELGDVVAFLASSRASWISGTSVVVDGCQSRGF